MQKAVLAARILLGLGFTLFGANHFVPFLPPLELSGAAGAFVTALLAPGYLFNFMKVVELVCGIMLLLGIFVPLSLTLLAPIILNIVMFHLFLEPSGLPLAAVILILELFLAWSYRGSFSGVLNSGAKPTA